MKKVVSVLILIVLAINFTACNNFNPELNYGVFGQLKTSTIISEPEVTVTNKGVSLNLHKTFFDGFTVFFLFSTDNYNPAQIGDKSEFLSKEGIYLHVNGATLSNKTHTIDLFDENATKEEKMNLMAQYNSETLEEEENYFILAFDNMDNIDVTLNYSLTVTLDEISDSFIFDNLMFEKNEYKTFSPKSDNSFSFLNAEGMIKSVTYTETRTIIDVEWNVENVKEFNDTYLNVYSKNNKVIFSVGDFKEFVYFDPLTSNGFDNMSTNSAIINSRYTFNVTPSQQDSLFFKEYLKDDQQSKGVPSKVICEIKI